MGQQVEYVGREEAIGGETAQERDVHTITQLVSNRPRTHASFLHAATKVRDLGNRLLHDGVYNHTA